MEDEKIGFKDFLALVIAGLEVILPIGLAFGAIIGIVLFIIYMLGMR